MARLKSWLEKIRIRVRCWWTQIVRVVKAVLRRAIWLTISSLLKFNPPCIKCIMMVLQSYNKISPNLISLAIKIIGKNLPILTSWSLIQKSNLVSSCRTRLKRKWKRRTISVGVNRSFLLKNWRELVLSGKLQIICKIRLKKVLKKGKRHLMKLLIKTL